MLLAETSSAQDPRIGDSLLQRGAVERAEAEYYAAAAARPRDPAARFALGQYLAARGALRIGATLIDEAVQFGYDRAAANAALGRIYLSLGAYDNALRLPGYVFAPGQRAWLTWLNDHPERASTPDSVVLIAFQRQATGSGGSLGDVSIQVDGSRLVARVSAQSGCTVRIADTSTVARSLHVFPPAAIDSTRRVFAAADSLSLNRLLVTNLAMTAERLGPGMAAVVCMELLARYAPTFDPRAGTVALHVAGSTPLPPHASMAMPLLDRGGEYQVLFNGEWTSLASPTVMRYLRDRRWTFDLRRRQVTIDP
jgi:tetratricopeptide (TPR) repeat protein